MEDATAPELTRTPVVAAPRPAARLAGTLLYYAPPLAGLVVFLGLWQLLVTVFNVPSYLVPSPLDVYNVTVEKFANLVDSTWLTLRASLTAFLVTAVVGSLAAFVLASSKLLERVAYPYVVLLQATPIIAIAPIIIIWFGVGFNSMVVISTIISIFPAIANTTQGLISVDHNLLNLFKLYGASSSKTLWMLRLPYALPYLITGLRISSGLSVVGVIVGEYFSGIGGGRGGLGFTIAEAAHRIQTPYLFAAGLASALLGISFFLTVNLVGHLLLRHWHESAARHES